MVPTIAMLLYSISINQCLSFAPISCNETVSGDTRTTKDGSHYSFTVTSNITSVWMSTCGSQFDASLWVKNSNKQIIARNNANFSAFCNNAILYLDNPANGDYTLKINSSKANDDGGQYWIRMFCNNFTFYDCNNVLQMPINVCFYDAYNTESYKYICDQDSNTAWRLNYLNSTTCNTNHSQKIEVINGYICDAPIDCQYVTLNWHTECDDAYSVTDNDWAWNEMALLLDVCLPGPPGGKIFSCSDDRVTVKYYDDPQCETEDMNLPPKHLVNGCNHLVSGNNVSLSSFECSNDNDNGNEDLFGSSVFFAVGCTFNLIVVIMIITYRIRKTRYERKFGTFKLKERAPTLKDEEQLLSK